MAILDKFSVLSKTRASLLALGIDPFSVTFDDVTSPTEAVIGGKPTMIFGSNNYLGLTYDPVVIAAGVEALKRYGTGTTGSRIANGTFAGHQALEKRLADFFGRKHGMVLSTGYQANLAMISTLAGKGDQIIIDADSHASIYDACRMGNAEVIRFRHNDPEDLAKRLKRLDGTPGEKLIVVEGIYSMMGDTAPMKEFAAVKRELGGYLLVDEAHSFGVLGEKGLGAAEAAGVSADVDFIVGTFSKSLAAVGGFCVSDIDNFDILRVVSRPYMFTASQPPSVIATVLAALDRLEADTSLRVSLRANAERFYGGLAKAGFALGPEVNPIVSVKLPDIATAAKFWTGLLDAGVYVNLAIPPATPTSEPLLRCSVTAAHRFEQIDRAVEIFTSIGTTLGVIGAAKAGA
ncbi:MAG: aminotransferase class I/II-fold pyridoxal phosphate-dependent enzyme [Rhizomicrobium sp.]